MRIEHPLSPSGELNDLQEHHKHTPTLPLISDCVYAQPRWRTIRACDAQQTATLVTQHPCMHIHRLTHTKSTESPLPQLNTAMIAAIRDKEGERKKESKMGGGRGGEGTPQYLLVPEHKR